jgi:glycine betaine/proline transport system ATP-binding protein
MSARWLMKSASTGDFAKRVRDDAKIASFAAEIVAADKPFGVVDENGTLIGGIEPRAVIDLLAGRETGS